MPENWQRAGFGLYLHWPFCASKCPYCDFNSHVVASIDEEAWLDAYLSELDLWAGRTRDRVLSTVFFGGGTPSLMSGQLVGAILDRIARNWRLANDLEATLEANPGSVEASRFSDFRSAGVNRVSLGLQALNDPDLKRLGRLHSSQEGIEALNIAMDTFDRVSFDLIYARQDQSLAGWRDELGRALSFGTDHLSLYQLTIEDGTAFGDRHRLGKLKGLPSDDVSADLYQLTQEMTAERDLFAYEVSNHARPGQEARHNQIYWRGGDFLGIGPGAHGRLSFGDKRDALENPKAPNRWLTDSSGPNGAVQVTPLKPNDVATEYLLMALRTSEGADFDVLDALAQGALRPGSVEELSGEGFLKVEDGHLRATLQGRPVLNAILNALVN